MLFKKNALLDILSDTRTGKPRLGRMARGLWLHFDLPLTRYHIALRKARRLLSSFEKIGALVFGLGFLGFAGWKVYSADLFKAVQIPTFWTSAGGGQSSVPLLFWLAIISLSFLLYKVTSGKNTYSDVESRDYGQIVEREEANVSLDWKTVNKLPRKKKKDISRTFTEEAIMALEQAHRVADKYGNPEVGAEHLIYSLLSVGKIRGVFIRMGIPLKKLQAQIGQSFQKQKSNQEPRLSINIQQTIFHAYERAYMARQDYVGATELLLAAVGQSEPIQGLLYDLEVDGQKLDNVVEWVRVREMLKRRRMKFRQAATHVNKHGMDRAMTAVATPFLNNFSQDITLAAKFGHLAPTVARDKEIEEIFRVIEGGRQSVVLVGGHGVGKMSIVEGITQRMIEGDVPKRLQDKRLVQLSTSALLAGTTVSGAQERLIRMISEIRRAGNIILFINNIHDLVSMNTEQGQEGLDVSETLAEYLGRGGVVMFSTATLDGYNRHINSSQLGSVLARVDVNVMDENQAIQVLESKVGGVEYKHNVFFSYSAIAQSVKLSSRFLHDQTLPGSALAIMSESASYARAKKGDNTIVSGEDVAAVIGDKTGIPTTSISEDESSKLLRLEDEMHKRVIGQREAVGLVANALRRARAEIRSTKRPIANFLFLGPTGVGKTELAKTIANVYFGGEERMIRVDMSEFQDKSGVHRLIGQPGQKGSGLLTEAVRQQPFSLVLLDEMEKADPDILNLFLQVFDDGRLTDSVGKVIDFTNTIIIATSNAGTGYVQEQINKGVTLEDIRQTLIRGELKKYYRPEFLNRFDGIVLFKSLERDEIKQIAGLMLKRVAKDLEKRGALLKVEDAGLEALAEVGFDPEFGARPMRRAIQDKIENQLAEFVLAGKLKRRDTVVIGEGANLRIESA